MNGYLVFRKKIIILLEFSGMYVLRYLYQRRVNICIIRNGIKLYPFNGIESYNIFPNREKQKYLPNISV